MAIPRTLSQEDKPISLTDLIDAAADLGVAALPPAAFLSAGRVWPAGDEWVAELGEPPSTRALGSLLATRDGARTALFRAIEAERDRLEERLRAAGGAAARLAESRARWAPPTVYTWDSADQRVPEVHTASVR